MLAFFSARFLRIFPAALLPSTLSRSVSPAPSPQTAPKRALPPQNNTELFQHCHQMFFGLLSPTLLSGKTPANRPFKKKISCHLSLHSKMAPKSKNFLNFIVSFLQRFLGFSCEAASPRLRASARLSKQKRGRNGVGWRTLSEGAGWGGEQGRDLGVG